jgi:LCP family protein required for cell wall assembly
MTAAGGYVLVRKYDGNINRISGALGLPGVARPAAGAKNSTTFLLVGSDSRGDLAPGQGTQGKGATFVKGQRSDTIIIAHLFAGSDKAQLISFPRDSWVQIPAFTDPSTGQATPAHMEKINSAFSEGGPALLVATVEQISGLRVDHFIQVDFEGFKSMVDQLGGVEVCLSKPAKEHDSGIDLPAGRQVIKGDQALAFVRQRKGLAQGDLDRIRRQQQFLGAIIRKTLSAGTLLNPIRLNGFLDALTHSLQVDDGLSISDMRDLALRMRGASAGGVAFTTVPVASSDGRRAGQSVVLLDDAADRRLFDRIRRDVPPDAPDAASPASTPSPGGPALTVAPRAVQVQVFNGGRINGLGSRAASELTSAGFTVTGKAQTRAGSTSVTTVYYGYGQQEAARTLVAAVPGSTMELDPTLTRTLQIVVGSSYNGVTPVSVGGTPAPSPTSSAGRPTPTPSAGPVTTAADDVCAP